jgi:hypothetical protein
MQQLPVQAGLQIEKKGPDGNTGALFYSAGASWPVSAGDRLNGGLVP